jgi:hypothetical protein
MVPVPAVPLACRVQGVTLVMASSHQRCGPASSRMTALASDRVSTFEVDFLILDQERPRPPRKRRSE